VSSGYIRQYDNTCRWEALGDSERADAAEAAEVEAQDQGVSIDLACTRPRQVEQQVRGMWLYMWPTVADQ
jgi:hypothetical protein